MTNIPCMEPTFTINSLLGGFFIIEIAYHNIRTLCQNLAIIGNFYIYIEKGFPHRAKTYISR